MFSCSSRSLSIEYLIMPNRAMKACAYPGCVTLVRAGYCEQHKRNQVKPYRDQAKQNLYGTTLWRKMRAIQLSREPWCAECLRANVYTPATDVDHIERHDGDLEVFYSSPLQSLCHACHSRKTAQEVWAC